MLSDHLISQSWQVLRWGDCGEVPPNLSATEFFKINENKVNIELNKTGTSKLGAPLKARNAHLICQNFSNVCLLLYLSNISKVCFEEV